VGGAGCRSPLNRLTTVTGPAAKSFTYDAFGNLATRTDVGTLSYFPGSHRLQNVSGTTTVGYSYNLAGDVTQITGGTVNGGVTRTINTTAFNLPSSIVQGSTTIAYGYDGNRTRITERRPNAAANQVNLTTYIGGGTSPLFEEDRLGAGNVTDPFRYRYKHTINTPEGAIGMVVIEPPSGANNNSALRSDKSYHRDHLGSTVAVTDEAGTEYLGYDAWGKRRNANGSDNATANTNPVALSTKTDRGYTNHEHIDDIGLIHMNGRLYDAYTGRMLSADPIIQAPYNLQNYNRYAYVMNNPLSLTDPSGFSWWTRHRRTILAIGVSLLIGGFDFSNFFANGSFRWELGFNGVGGAIAGGFASGGIMGGNIESAVNGAFSAALFYGVGELSGAHEAAAAGRSMTGAEHLAQTFGHAVVGCVSASIAGGSCGSGAASAGFAAAAGPLLPGADISPERFFARVIVGGTASRLAGGSFANGATSAAFAYLFNDVAGKGSRVAKAGESILRSLAATTDADVSYAPRLTYDRTQVGEIAYALSTLASSQGENFLYSDMFAPERAMLARVVAGSSDRYTVSWFRHEIAEAQLLRSAYGLTGEAYVMANRAAHEQVLNMQGNGSTDLYAPSVVRRYPSEFLGPAWDKVRGR
jgi:RHS repeat-associated protein